jgi:3-methyl-2-oxobutanoate hydroxymethyltransferase
MQKTKLTIKDLLDKKGKEKLTELCVTNALEAYASEQAGINMLIVSFNQETLRTGVPTNKWFRDAHVKDIRDAAPNTFMIYAGGQYSSPEKAIDGALIARDNGADAVYCGSGPKIIEALRSEGLPAVSHIGLIPYKSTWTGGFKAVGKDAESAFKVYQDALAYDQAGAIGLEVECVADRVAEIITKKVNLLTLSMGSGPHCDVEFLFIQDVVRTNTDRVPRHAKVFKDTNKSYEKLLDETVEGIKSFVKDVNNKNFPTPKNIVSIDDEEYEKFLDKVG